MKQNISEKIQSASGFKFQIRTYLGDKYLDSNPMWVSEDDFNRFDVGDKIEILITKVTA